MSQVLLRAWTQRGLLARLLWPLSLVLRGLLAVRRAAYRAGWLASHRLPVPVVVVGNVVAGGAGKTPLTLALLEHLATRGLRAGVVSRGYGRAASGCTAVTATTPPAQAGDEPLLIARRARVPVFVDSDRAAAARALLRAHPATQVIVSDDGLQHLALARDIEVCAFDDRGTGNGWLLPAGPLREPWPRRVDLVVHTGSHPAFGGWRARRSLARHAVRADGSTTPLTALAGVPLTALAGIAQPSAFFAMLREQGLLLDEALALPDHNDFTGTLAALNAANTLVCTEKDAVKLWTRRPDAWAVPLQVTLDAGLVQAFDALLDAKLSLPHGSQTA
ncbi:MAG: tetraacyldisaccharide 4'-kinase [Ramlibacter sp.]